MKFSAKCNLGITKVLGKRFDEIFALARKDQKGKLIIFRTSFSRAARFAGICFSAGL